LIGAYSEKEGAAGTFKGGFGFHPLLGYLDETREALAGVLRPGNAGANTAADHLEVVERALGQLPRALTDLPGGRGGADPGAGGGSEARRANAAVSAPRPPRRPRAARRPGRSPAAMPLRGG